MKNDSKAKKASFKIKVGLGSCGIAAGAGETYEEFLKFSKKQNFVLETVKTSCLGACFREPLIEVTKDNSRFLYGPLKKDQVAQFLTDFLIFLETKKETDFLKEISVKKENYFLGQVKIALRNCGVINPEDIEEAIEKKAYAAIKKIAKEKISAAKIIEIVKKSGLRGRGGGGFLTGLKWEIAQGFQSKEKYIICNADEGDPGAFMDRSILEGDSHSVIEGMLIAGLAIGAKKGVIYCRAEYPLAIERLRIAIKQAEAKKFLKEKNLFGIQGFNFEVSIKEGAGAFVCGEETALIASIEGKRGMPRKRPPFPAQKGLRGQPTNINNVETYANVAYIILNGAKEYAKYGTKESKGTKVFALTGKVKKTGLIEVPMGTTLEEIIFKMAGGIEGDKKFKAVQLGGPSGGCIPSKLKKTLVDYESIKKTGAIIGSGGMVVMDETTCMVDLARFFLDFTQKESCGKCTFCRVGTKRMLEILDKIIAGKGKMEDLAKLEELAEQIKSNSLCGLGQTAPNPVTTTLKYFKEEYISHIKAKKCPAGVCSALVTYEIDSKKCVGCTLCAKKCPVDAIKGEVKKPHEIIEEKCIKCGLCFKNCNFGAIIKQ
jgi:NADH-quinone oxidoreductase subunit F